MLSFLCSSSVALAAATALHFITEMIHLAAILIQFWNFGLVQYSSKSTGKNSCDPNYLHVHVDAGKDNWFGRSSLPGVGGEKVQMNVLRLRSK